MLYLLSAVDGQEPLAHKYHIKSKTLKMSL